MHMCTTSFRSATTYWEEHNEHSRAAIPVLEMAIHEQVYMSSEIPQGMVSDSKGTWSLTIKSSHQNETLVIFRA
jgi:hypothetical protein